MGNDVRILGLPLRRPDTEHAVRMLCRHNRYVQEFGRVRDADEMARRERVWDKAIEAIELQTGHESGARSAPAEFRRLHGRGDRPARLQAAVERFAARAPPRGARLTGGRCA